MSRKWIKRIGIIIAIPIVLVILIVILIYIPPVQNFLQRKVTAYVSRTTGMDITIDHVNIRFPLDLVAKDVRIIQAPDTILALENLGLKVRLRPLFNGDIEAHGVFLENAAVNTANMIPTMQLSGQLGRLYVDTKVIRLSEQLVDLETAELNDANILLIMRDTVVVDQDTTQTAMNWRILLPNLEVKNVAFNMEIPADTMTVNAYIGDGQIKDIVADLGTQTYSINNISIEQTRGNYDKGILPPARGVDPAHIAVRDVRIEMDSILYRGQEMAAVIRELTMNERSGLSITSMSGRLYADSTMLRVPAFNMQTPHSEIDFTAQTYWEPQTSFQIDRLQANLNARLGKQDVLLLAGDMPASFQRDYPSRPFVVQLAADGNMNNLQISRISAELPGTISLTGSGQVLQITDSINRSGDINLQLRTQRLDFLLSLAGIARDGSIVIPPLSMNAGVKLNGSQVAANLLARESVGTIVLNGTYNLASEAYKADIKIDSLQVNHFLPRDSIYSLSATANATGRGINFSSPRTTATTEASVDMLEYGRYRITGIDLTAELKNALATAHITSNNELLVMDAWGEYRMNTRNIDARASVNVADVNLQELGIIDRPMRNTFSLALSAEAKEDSVQLFVVSGDLEARLRARGPVQELISRSTTFANELMQQIDARLLNHVKLREALPTARLNLKAGPNNPVSRYVGMNNIRFNNLSAIFAATPQRGLNGGLFVSGLHVDTLQLDTVYLAAFQDTARLNLRAGIINGPQNPQYTFRGSLTGEIRSEDAEIMLDYLNERGEQGMHLGANIRPTNDGVQIQFIPETPVLAFRNFRFYENEVFIRNNGRVLANLEMLDSLGTGIRVHSLPDTTYLQNLDIEIRRIELGDISRVLPYYPSFAGMFSLEATFQQTQQNMQLSAEANINDLIFEGRGVGNIGLGATWLPGSEGRHYLDAYLGLEGNQVLTANGTFQTGTQDNLNVNATLEHFPLYVANAFVPEGLIALSGDLDGDLAVTGPTSQPMINGELRLDSIVISSPQYGVNFNLDERPLQITNSLLTLNDFAIYTANRNNPFTINGTVDFSNLSNARADLTLLANNYELLNAPRTDNSILYGQAYIDLNTTIRGPLNALAIRGNLNLLGNTKAHYVLTDSPLTVQDRLGNMVEFVSFSDTVQVAEEPTGTLTGIDMAMTINIEETAQVGVDLTRNRSSYADIEGGGNLSFQYTPEGEMSLTGRYTANGGNLKYSLPVIPLKEFAINQGSYVDWVGDPMNPRLNLKATERMRVQVPDGEDNTRYVSFDVSIELQNTLDDLELVFDIVAPEDPDIRQELEAMAPEERSKQAVAMMATGIYMARGSAGSGDFNLGSTLNNLVQNQLFGLAGNALKSANITFGRESYDNAGEDRTDYNFKYSQRLFNDRVQVVIGGTITTGNEMEVTNSFIDNVSLEYRLDKSGTRYVRVYHDRNYENVFEGEIVETGVGLLLRKKVNKLGELFIFRRNRNNNQTQQR